MSHGHTNFVKDTMEKLDNVMNSMDLTEAAGK